MPDVTEGAAEIIAQAVLGQAGWFDGHMLLSTLDGWDSSDEQVGQLALAALAAAGFAVVQLPEPVVGLDWDWCAVLPGGNIDDLVTESGLLTPAEAQEKAAALLAAAVSGANKTPKETAHE